MKIIPPPLEQAVGRAWAAEVYDRLTHEMFGNLRFAMPGLIAALVLYYAMLILDSRAAAYIPWMIAHGASNFIIALYSYRAEKWIGNTVLRSHVSVGTACANGILLGIGFLVHFPAVQNPKMQIAIVALVVGVAGAGAFTLACHRFSFILFTFPWLLPISFHLVFFSGEAGYRILGSMSVPYLAVLTVLCWKDYQRRVELIKAELVSREERNEIAASLHLVQELKDQQDHDYYLTSLLVKPFAVNAIDPGENVHVAFFTKQKKEFQFRREPVSIGGDLSLSHTLRFSGRPMTIIVNADAMGKSIQGAGGSLVFGAVFQAIIDRARQGESRQPTVWLRETIIELQKIFETFDCSMLVSAFFILIENDSGVFHYISAEHPQAVIFRNGRANFLKGQHRLLKLGMPEFREDFGLNTGRLFPADILVIGSDGRDDIVQGEFPNGNPRINTDAAKFLRTVEAAAADLNLIAEQITTSGEVSDDLSLIRIGFQRPASRTLPAEIRPATALREARDLLNSGNTGAAESIIVALSEAPLLRSALIACLKMSLRLRKFSLAGTFADRLYRGYPKDAQALFWSAHANFYLGNTDLALDQLRRASPEGNPPRIRRLSRAPVVA